jgi:hypothetical protein
MDLAHDVKSSTSESFGSAPEKWKEFQEYAIKTPEGALHEKRIVDSRLIGRAAFTEIANGMQGYHLDVGGTIQGVVSYEEQGDTIRIHNLSTAPWNFPGSKDPRKVKGAGTRLLTELFSKAVDDGFQNVELETTGDATKFYEAVGFKETRPLSRIMTIDREGMNKFLEKFE